MSSGFSNIGTEEEIKTVATITIGCNERRSRLETQSAHHMIVAASAMAAKEFRVHCPRYSAGRLWKGGQLMALSGPIKPPKRHPNKMTTAEVAGPLGSTNNRR